jgi:hypothetical protein
MAVIVWVFKEVEVIVPNFGRVGYEVDVTLYEARAAVRRILATISTSRAPFIAPPAVAV